MDEQKVKSKSELIASLLVILAGICWGIIGVFTRSMSNHGLSSIQITASRCFVVAICLIIYLTVKDRKKLVIDIKDIWYFAGTGIISIIFFNTFYFITINKTTLSLASILLYTAPSFVMIMSTILFKEKVTKQKLIALCLAFLGCVFTTGLLSNNKINVSLMGIITGVASGFFYALYSIFGSIALKKYHPMTVTVYTFIVASIAIIPFCNIGQLINLSLYNTNLLLNILLIGIISTLIPFLAYTKGLERLEAGKAAVVAFVEPMVATFTGIVVFKEVLTYKNVIGIILIFIAIVLLNIKINKNNQTTYGLDLEWLLTNDFLPSLQFLLFHVLFHVDD